MVSEKLRHDATVNGMVAILDSRYKVTFFCVAGSTSCCSQGIEGLLVAQILLVQRILSTD